jgi:precorrin-6A synthase
MKELLVVGIGAGDPEHMTVAAANALARADVILTLDRATSDLTSAREELIARYAPQARSVLVQEPRRDRAASDYAGAVGAWREARAAAWSAVIEREDGVVAFLVWGDPMLYDSTIAILRQIGVEFRVIPGISSISALCAAHRIPLNRVAGEVLITTGRRLAAGWPEGATDVVVMLDSGGAFRAVLEQPLDIYWGAYLGTPDELLVAGPLAQVADEIERLRSGARERRGWIMDTYLLRSRETE